MKRIVSLFMVMSLMFTLFFCLSGCSKKGVDYSQLKEDLNLCNEVQDCFTSEYGMNSRYQVTDCVIIENILENEETENTIYCNVTAENESFQLLLDVKAVYEYYEKKGWVLDEVSCDLDDVKALSGPDIEQVKPIILSHIDDYSFTYSIPYEYEEGYYGTKYFHLYGYDNDFSIIDTTLSKNGKIAKINCCYESEGTNYYGYYEMYFDKTGWYFSEEDLENMYMILSETDYDYESKAVGTFYNLYDMDTVLVIHNIEDNTITYSLQTTDSILLNNDFEQGENLTAEFDSKIGEFRGFYYNIDEDMWNFGAVDLERSSFY